MTATASGRPPIWRDVRVLAWAFQIVVLGVVVAVVWVLYRTYLENAEAQNLRTGFDYLDQPAGFPIPSSDFRPSQPVWDAIVEGLKNTLRLSLTGIVLATVLGTLIGIARLSPNFILRSAAKAYVEIVRNVPLLALVTLAFVAIVLNAFPPPNESWRLGPIAVLNVRGSSVFWYEGQNWKFVVVVVLTLLTLWARGPLAARRRRPHRPARRAAGCGRSPRRSSCCSWPGSSSASAPARPSSTAGA